MSFKNDAQRRAAFANMGRFSIVSCDSAPKVVGITADGAEDEMRQWKEMYSDNRFSDQESIAVDGKTYKPEKARIVGDEDLAKAQADELEELANEISSSEDVEVDVDGNGGSTEEFVTEEHDVNVSYGSPADGVSYEQTFETGDVTEAVGDYDSRFKTDVIEPAKEGSVRAEAVIRQAQAVDDISQKDTRPFLERASKAFITGDTTIQTARVVGYDKFGDPVIKSKVVDEGGIRGAVLHDVAGFGSSIGRIPTSIGSGIKKTGAGLVRGVETAAAPALGRGALAFGTVAGGAVASGLSEVGDIMEAPKREYHMPPGYQKVYDYGSGKYRTEKVQRQPMEPFVSQLGAFDTPGVRVRPEQVIAGQESMQRGFWGMTSEEAEKSFKDRAKKTGGSGFRTTPYMPIRGVSRTASSALRQKSDFDRMRSLYGDSSPRVQRQEAALQSKVSYLDRKTVPGTNQDLIMRSSGLMAV